MTEATADVLSEDWVPLYQSTYAAVSAPVEPWPHPAFQYLRGGSHGDDTAQAFKTLEDQLFAAGNSPRAYLVENMTLFGSGFLLHNGKHFLRETRYLVVDLEPRLKRSQQNKSEASSDLYWIMAANASSNNYWHWTAQSLPAIYQSLEFLKTLGISNVGLIVPVLNTYQREYLQLAGLGDYPVLEVRPDQTLHVRHLVYSQLLGGGAAFLPNRFRYGVRDMVKTRAHAAQVTRSGRLYLSRQDAVRRPLLNESDLENRLKDDGFEIVRASELSVAEQVRLADAAELIVAPHGAALTNGLFSNPGSVVYELGQLTYPNAGPASLLRISGAIAVFDFFADDGLSALTAGWKVNQDTVVRTLEIIYAILHGGGVVPMPTNLPAANKT